ncbi:MAG: NAD-dependent epimerase/dehydratase family protein [Pseudomonadota bacterium]
MQHILVTGGAGFIGSNLVDRLLSAGYEVTVFDNFSTGRREFLASAEKQNKFHLVEADLLDQEALTAAMKGCDFVFHLAANADVRFGTEHPEKDLQQNTIATFNVLEAMRSHDVRKVAFSSTGSVYGEAVEFPTPEHAAFPVQTSLYGASKLAGEGLITAYSEGFGMQCYIFRFVSILGERYTHGHVFDFYKQLLDHPDTLTVLGNGKQRKSYLYIQDCIDAMLLAIQKSEQRVNIFNLGTDEYVEVVDSIASMTSHLELDPELTFTGGERGWIGDNPFIFLQCERIRQLGWSPQMTIREGVVKTLEWLQENHWALESS